METVTDMVTCGVDGHDILCLCDVHIPDTPTATSVSLTDNWVLAMVADYFDLSWPWTPDKFGFLLQKASVFLEEYSKNNISNLVTSTNIEPQHGSEPWPHYVGRVKRQIEQIVLELGPQSTPTQVFELCGIDHNEMVRLLTMNKKQGDDVPVGNYDLIVTKLRAGVTMAQICRDHDVRRPNGNGSGLLGWLQETFVKQFQEDK